MKNDLPPFSPKHPLPVFHEDGASDHYERSVRAYGKPPKGYRWLKVGELKKKDDIWASQHRGEWDCGSAGYFGTPVLNRSQPSARPVEKKKNAPTEPLSVKPFTVGPYDEMCKAAGPAPKGWRWMKVGEIRKPNIDRYADFCGKTSLLPASLFNLAVSAKNHLPHLTPIRPPKPKIDLAAKVEELEKRLAALESWRKS